MEREEKVRAEPLGFEVGRGELRAGADIFRELRVVLAGEGGLGDRDVVFSFAVEMGGPSVRVLDREEFRALAQMDLILVAEEVGG